jgi:hypothetical protein
MPHKLKDLARLTLRFTSCSRMAHALAEGLQGAGIEVLTLKNKYASPTPMGYSDFNLCAGVVLSDGTRYVCEIQLNHVDMLEAKKEAHVHYEKVREELPALCQGTKVVMPGSSRLLSLAASARRHWTLQWRHSRPRRRASSCTPAPRERGQERPRDSLRELRLAPGRPGRGLRCQLQARLSRGSGPAWTEAEPIVELIAAAREPASRWQWRRRSAGTT